MFEENLRQAIQKYLDAEPHRKSAFKGVMTRLINSSPDITVEVIQKVIAEFKDLPQEITQRFTKGSFYESGGLVYGWVREGQLQAEPIPVYMSVAREEPERRFIRVIRNQPGLGFAEALRLPFLDGRTEVPWEETDLYARSGWANACDLQWYWKEGENYVVSRSIIPYGFWQAWKWWDGARNWYLEHRPELFEDEEIWQTEPVRHEPIDNPYAAVLGDKNRELFEARKFYLDD